jgi:hypothetical protein
MRKYAQGILPFLLPLSVLLFEPSGQSRKRMEPFLGIGTLTTHSILWALAAYPTEIFAKDNSIVYINPATNNATVALFYVIATCGSLLFSKVKDMVIFGVSNMVMLLTVMAVKRYAFHIFVVRLCGGCKRDHPRLLLEEQQNYTFSVRRGEVKGRPCQ